LISQELRERESDCIQKNAGRATLHGGGNFPILRKKKDASGGGDCTPSSEKDCPLQLTVNREGVDLLEKERRKKID